MLNVNAAPKFTGLTPWVVQEGQRIYFRAFAFDPDNPQFIPPERTSSGDLLPYEATLPTVTYEVTGLPEGASFDPVSSYFDWIPDYSSSGAYTITFTATDNGDNTGTNQSDTVTIPIRVLNTNRAPAIKPISNQSLNRAEVLSLTIKATDEDGDPIILTASGLPGFDVPDFATFTDHQDGTASLILAPSQADRGDYPITVTATDGENSSETSLIVSVEGVNDPPRFSYIGDTVAVVGETAELELVVTDSDQDELTFSTTGLPPGVILTPSTVYGRATLEITPDTVGVHPLTITVTDSGNGNTDAILTDSISLNLVVRTENQAPVLAPVGILKVREGETLTLPIVATDGDGDTFTYSATNLSPGADLDPQTGLLTWTPTYLQSAIYSNINVKVSDGYGSSNETITIQVENVNQAPVLIPLLPQSGREGTLLQFILAGGDVDGDALIFHSDQLPVTSDQ